jgi:ketosteroid isomerase-like protein
MSGNKNIETIKAVYDAFARGDAAAILDVVTTAATLTR